MGETVSGRVGATGAGLHFRGAADGDIGSEVTATARRWDHSWRRVSRVRLGRCEHSLVVILTIASRSNLRGKGTNCGERSCRVGSESGTIPLLELRESPTFRDGDAVDGAGATIERKGDDGRVLDDVVGHEGE